jgi:hypothetical protein
MAAAPDPRKLHSVKYGTNDIGSNTPANKIPSYMNDQQGTLSPYDTQDTTQTLNRELLQIISQGINNIVNNLKNKLGNNFTESNQSSLAIKKRLDDLKKEIDNDIGRKLANPDLNAISIYLSVYNSIYNLLESDVILHPEFLIAYHLKSSYIEVCRFIMKCSRIVFKDDAISFAEFSKVMLESNVMLESKDMMDPRFVRFRQATKKPSIKLII